MKLLINIVIFTIILTSFSCKKEVLNDQDISKNNNFHSHLKNDIQDGIELIPGYKLHNMGCILYDGLGNPISTSAMRCTLLPANISNCSAATACESITKNSYILTNELTALEKEQISESFAQDWVKRGIINHSSKQVLIEDCVRVLNGETLVY